MSCWERQHPFQWHAKGDGSESNVFGTQRRPAHSRSPGRGERIRLVALSHGHSRVRRRGYDGRNGEAAALLRRTRGKIAGLVDASGQEFAGRYRRRRLETLARPRLEPDMNDVLLPFAPVLPDLRHTRRTRRSSDTANNESRGSRYLRWRASVRAGKHEGRGRATWNRPPLGVVLAGRPGCARTLWPSSLPHRLTSRPEVLRYIGATLSGVRNAGVLFAFPLLNVASDLRFRSERPDTLSSASSEP